jgi:uncharacterized protein (TIGR02646 family)
MITIARPAPSAAALASLGGGNQKVADLVAEIALDPHAGQNPSFKFDGSIYGHGDVKSELIALQRGKCAYCEGKFSAFAYGDTEHYRPKGYSQQSVGGRTIRPGYYWLAYEWTNLHYSCEKCNRQRKRNVFPLRNPAARARSPADNLGLEDPMLLDPTGQRDPAGHIKFNGAVPEARTDIGRMTIDLYYLDRIPLNAARLDHLKTVDSLRKLVMLAAELDASVNSVQFGLEAEAELARMVQPDAAFSAMTHDYLNPN